MKQKIVLCGFGAFNASIALHLDRKKEHELHFWDVDAEIKSHFAKHKSHPYHFTDIKFSEHVYSGNVESIVKDADHILIGVSSQAVREVIRQFVPHLNSSSTITIVGKGFETGSHKRLSEVAKQELSKSQFEHPVAVFSGGTVAGDVAKGAPLIAEVASLSKETREKVADLFHSKNLRIYTNDDVLSVELAGALKNIVSLGAGVCEGLGYDVGTQASFITRACFEIYKLAKVLGAKDETFLPGSASFWGDIMLSSFGKTRNREFGKRIVGKSPEMALKEMKNEHKTVEGFWTVRAAHELTQEHKVDAPIIDVLFQIVHKNMDPRIGLVKLMSRDRTSISKH